MGMWQINKGIAEGARWARIVALIYGVAGCVCAIIAIWLPCTPLTLVTTILGTVAGMASHNYLKSTRGA